MDENGRLREGSGTEDEPTLEEGKQRDLQPIRTVTLGVWRCTSHPGERPGYGSEADPCGKEHSGERKRGRAEAWLLPILMGEKSVRGLRENHQSLEDNQQVSGREAKG